ncbi:MAG: ribosome biogenesis GTPase Der [Candidatus Alcyoniella australis]|nr:ribosome biogenesis GTPase Der [Candidatus Alcyoniella australis]
MIAIIGRPNVGKSQLFNRLVRSRSALVEDIPGVTRDLRYGKASWEDRSFMLVDTGGFDSTSEDPLIEQVRLQLEFAVSEADRILFLLDARQGISALDEELALWLRKIDKPLFVAANKVDAPSLEPLSAEFYRLGVDHVYPISAKERYGLSELMDDLLEGVPEQEQERPRERGAARVAVVGRPNVGKSSLINALLGSQRMIVSEIPGTTRDSIDIEVILGDESMTLIDTAGIRRRPKVKEKLEKFAVIQALRSLERTDLACVVIDASQPLSEQDVRIVGYAHERGRGLVLLLNKWDLVTDKKKALRAFADMRELKMPFADYAPMVTTSATQAKGLDELVKAVIRTRVNHGKRLSTPICNKILANALTEHPPPAKGGRAINMLYMAQTYVAPPTFAVVCNRPEAVHFSYQRYLQNRIRQSEDFSGTPIWIKFRRKGHGKK